MSNHELANVIKLALITIVSAILFIVFILWSISTSVNNIDSSLQIIAGVIQAVKGK